MVELCLDTSIHNPTAAAAGHDSQPCVQQLGALQLCPAFAAVPRATQQTRDACTSKRDPSVMGHRHGRLRWPRMGSLMIARQLRPGSSTAPSEDSIQLALHSMQADLSACKDSHVLELRYPHMAVPSSRHEKKPQPTGSGDDCCRLRDCQCTSTRQGSPCRAGALRSAHCLGNCSRQWSTLAASGL